MNSIDVERIQTRVTELWSLRRLFEVAEDSQVRALGDHLQVLVDHVEDLPGLEGLGLANHVTALVLEEVTLPAASPDILSSDDLLILTNWGSTRSRSDLDAQYPIDDLTTPYLAHVLRVTR